MTTLTVKLHDCGETQSQLEQKLRRLLRSLVVRGITPSADVEAAYPGDEQSRWKTTFVVEVSDQAQMIADMLSAIPEVERAYVAPERG
jgi:hypothetical protein